MRRVRWVEESRKERGILVKEQKSNGKEEMCLVKWNLG